MESRCPACHQTVLFIRKPVYDGFTRTGEELVCSSCGAKSAVQAPAGPAKPAAGTAIRKPSIFDDDDLPSVPKLFADGEGSRICRHCTHYLVNPFTQRCSRHNRNIEATDTCSDFRMRK